MSCILGRKSNFAIEYEITNKTYYLMGSACLWIGGYKVGTYQEVMLMCTTAQLQQIIETIELRKSPEFLKLSDNEIFDYIFGDSEVDNGLYLVSLDESYDHFIMIAYLVDNMIHFIWRIEDQWKSDFPNYPNGLIHKTVSKEEFLEVSKQFVDVIR